MPQSWESRRVSSRSDSSPWPMMSRSLQITVVITTQNRKEELRTAIRSALKQTASPEVIVIDDGSTDGTKEMVRRDFPDVRLIAHDRPAGYIARRNEGARLATGDLVLSIDDDAAFASAHTIEQTIREFSPEIGAVAIPYVNVNSSPRVWQQAPDAGSIYATDTYIGTAHAVRRSLFLELGGYQEQFVHQGEESDFCIRMLAAGYAVRLGNADPIHHFESPRRDLRRMDFYGSRNAVLYAWRNVPLLFLLFHLPATTARCLLLTFRADRFSNRLAGVIDGYRECLRTPRRPVSWSVYRLGRVLRKRGPMPLADVALPGRARAV
jgi:glycosyltransferase involved in cell wall biosynthesis